MKLTAEHKTAIINLLYAIGYAASWTGVGIVIGLIILR